MAKRMPSENKASPAVEDSLAELEKRAEKIREANERDKDGRLLARYPGLYKEPFDGFDKSAFRKSLVDAQAKLAKWISCKDAAKLLGFESDYHLRHKLCNLAWYGLGWKSGSMKYRLKHRAIQDGEKLQASYVLYTPDGSHVFTFIKLIVETA